MAANVVWEPVENESFISNYANGNIKGCAKVAPGGKSITLTMEDPDAEGYVEAEISFNSLAICRAVPAVWLDAPDGDGEYAFVGSEVLSIGVVMPLAQKIIAEVFTINGITIVKANGRSVRVEWLKGKWQRLNIAWPSQEGNE